MSNCYVKFSAKSVDSDGENRVISRKLTFRKVANVISHVKCSWWAKVTALTKNAIKQSEIDIIT